MIAETLFNLSSSFSNMRQKIQTSKIETNLKVTQTFFIYSAESSSPSKSLHFKLHSITNRITPNFHQLKIYTSRKCLQN